MSTFQVEMTIDSANEMDMYITTSVYSIYYIVWIGFIIYVGRRFWKKITNNGNDYSIINS